MNQVGTIIEVEVMYVFVYMLVIGSLHLQKLPTSTKSGPKEKRVKGMHLLVVLSVMGGDQCQNSVFCNSAYVSVLCYSLVR